MGIAEDIRADLRDAVRDVKARDLLVRLENIVSQHRQLAVLADRDIGQLGAEVERITINLLNGIRDRDSGQAAVAKGAPTDPLQLRAFFKGHALQLAAPVEVKLADGCNVFADHNLLNLLLVSLPWHMLGNAFHHFAVAVNDQSSIAVENKDRRLTTQSSI